MDYKPIILNDQTFGLGGKVSAALSRAEMELIRAEDRILASPSSQAVLKALSRFEALMSSRVVTGKKIGLLSLLRLETALQLYPLNEKNNELLERLILSESLQDDLGLLETFRYMQALEWISRVIDVKSNILPKTILNIHSRCMYGPIRLSEKVGFRKTKYQAPLNTPDKNLYTAPLPDEIPALIEDYCAFVNKDLFCPSAQAGLSHFQIESIHPFEDSLDGTERALSHMIFFKRGLSKRAIAPLALGPARDTENHARYFVPHQVGHVVNDIGSYINSGKIFSLCAHYTLLAAKSMHYYLNTITKLEDLWRERMGKIEKGSIIDVLLYELPGMPMITVNSASRNLGRSFSATNDALIRLQKAGILEPVACIQKNHAFVAAEAVQAYEMIDQKIISRNPIARDDIFG